MHDAHVLEHAQTIAELNHQGFCLLPRHFDSRLIDACRDGFWPTLQSYLKVNADRPNRGPERHFLPMPFEASCYSTEFFFNADVLSIVRGVMDDRVVADQWGCDVSLKGSEHQQFHVDFQRPLFAERPELQLPPYMLTVSFGLVPIAEENGAMEIAPCTHRIPRKDALQQIASGTIIPRAIPLDIGDILVRHPWAMHRGTPNKTSMPRPLVTIRYVRRWYADDSREVNRIPEALWRTLNDEQRSMMRFPR